MLWVWAAVRKRRGGWDGPRVCWGSLYDGPDTSWGMGRAEGERGCGWRRRRKAGEGPVASRAVGCIIRLCGAQIDGVVKLADRDGGRHGACGQRENGIVNLLARRTGCP